jgi:hypothetical protein
LWRRWRVGIDGMLHLIEQRLLPLFLLAKEVNVILVVGQDPLTGVDRKHETGRPGATIRRPCNSHAT